VGLADPRALEVAVAAARALDWVGLPEAQYNLAEATAYLSATTKSSAAGRAYFAALEDVLEHGSLPVPAHLRSTGPARRKYKYPHDFEGDDVEQQYLPDELAGRRYYFPEDQGAEARIGERLNRLREARRETPRRKKRVDGGFGTDPMSTGSEGMRRRRASLTKLSDEQRQDAGD
jgi:putative ATPase